MARHRHEELDRVPVAVEGELCLGHAAVGDEAARGDAALPVAVDPHRTARLAVLDAVRYEVAGRGLWHVGRGEGHADDDTVTGAEPEAGAGHQQGGDPDKGEAELASAWGRRRQLLAEETILVPLLTSGDSPRVQESAL